MSPSHDEHLESLRQRWEQNPGSRVFLQLAEEYRRAGELEEATRVLEAGLKANPDSLGAQVALGRCHLERGAADAAARAFEKVLTQDATHLVALKNLALAYHHLDDRQAAREKLELYRNLNPSDAELEEIEALVGGVAKPQGGSTGGEVPGRESSGDGSVDRERPFALEPREIPPPDLWRLVPGGPEGPSVADEQGAAGVAGVMGREEPFPGLDEEVRSTARLSVLDEPLAAARSEPAAARPSGGATVTLGRLYLEQGHLDEAEGVFREVLEVDPGETGAWQGLAEVEQQRSHKVQLQGQESREEPAVAPQEAAPTLRAADGSERDRRVTVLRDYLEKIRQRRGRDVS